MVPPKIGLNASVSKIPLFFNNDNPTLFDYLQWIIFRIIIEASLRKSWRIRTAINKAIGNEIGMELIWLHQSLESICAYLHGTRLVLSRVISSPNMQYDLANFFSSNHSIKVVGSGSCLVFTEAQIHGQNSALSLRCLRELIMIADSESIRSMVGNARLSPAALQKSTLEQQNPNTTDSMRCHFYRTSTSSEIRERKPDISTEQLSGVLVTSISSRRTTQSRT